MIRAYSQWKLKNQYLKISEYLHLSFNKWPSIQYKLWVSIVLWNHNNGEHCWFENGPEDDHWVTGGHYWKGGGVVQGVLYQSILNAKLTGRKKLGRKMCTSNRDDRKLENTVKQSRIKHLGELHTELIEAGVSASRVTKPLLNQKHRQKHLTWAKEKNNVSGYVCNHGSRVGNETLRPLGVATGNALSVTRSEDTYVKTPPVGRRQPMTSLPACHNISAAGRIHHQLLRLKLASEAWPEA